MAGREQEIAVLFADLRGFTRIAEQKLPYDVVFLLNRYFDTVGDAIQQAGGIVNQLTGDGVMALFGLDNGPGTGCRQALSAAAAMVSALAALSQALKEELDAPLRIGIGIHAGRAVVGHMGRGVAMYLTAVGDTVHVASRLQDLTKEYGCQLVISDSVAEQAGVNVSAFPRSELMVRNRRNPIVIRSIDDVQALARRMENGREG
jgi:adenylate cyclase